MGLRICVATLAAGLLGCATSVTLDPDPPAVAGGFTLPARIDYPGDRQYLPATVVEAGPDSVATAPVAVYRTQTRYELSSPWQILNPLMMLGFRGIGADVTVDGHLEVRSGEAVAASYAARCVVKLRRSVWRWNVPSQADLRARGLVAVRELIEAEMIDAQPALEALSGGQRP